MDERQQAVESSRPTPGPEITRWLKDWQAGDPVAFDRVVESLLDHLHQIAKGLFRNERRNHTLQPTAVINEVYLKLRNQRAANWKGRAHFLSIAAMSMRRVLVDHHRRFKAQRRGGGFVHVSWDDMPGEPVQESFDLEGVDMALDELARRSPRQSRIVEMKIFAGLGLQQIAEVEELHPRTVSRDWRTARLFLLRAMEKP